MYIRFYNCRILTMEKGFDIINAELWVRDSKIDYIGEYKEGFTFDREIDCKNNLVMPSFKNAHTHSAMTFLRSLADDMPLEAWLNDKVFPMEARLEEGDCGAFSAIAMCEYIEGGTTAFMDMYNFEKETAEAADEIGVRAVLCGALNNFVSSLRYEEESYNKLNSYSPYVSKVFGFHAVYTCSEELLKGLAELLKKYKAPVYTHCMETEAEVNNCIKATGKAPFEYLDSLGMWEYGGGVYHCVHPTQRELDIIKAKNINVISCPASNLKLASGIAPLEKIYSMGINTALGTDGAASNNALDMFREMYLATALQKYKESKAMAMPAENVLYMATVGGARAMGLNNCDVLAVGKDADLIIFNLNKPNMYAENNIVKNIVYSGGKQNIDLTMCRGKILYEKGSFNLPYDEIVSHAIKRAEKFIQ